MITHTEIIVLAIKQIECRLDRIRAICDAKGNGDLYKELTSDLYKKWNDLTELYSIETGDIYSR